MKYVGLDKVRLYQSVTEAFRKELVEKELRLYRDCEDNVGNSSSMSTRESDLNQKFIDTVLDTQKLLGIETGDCVVVNERRYFIGFDSVKNLILISELKVGENT